MIGKFLRCVRRNHALEHATIALLGRRHPGAQVIGLSGPRGFLLYTDLSLQEVFPAVTDALKFLKAGHDSLAIHENCGTNLVAAAAMTTAVTALGMRRRKKDFGERLESVLKLTTLNAFALLMARPVGSWLQSKLTVDTDVENVDISYVRSEGQGDARRIHVYTRQS